MKRDVILQKQGWTLRESCHVFFSVKLGYLLELIEESEVNCSGIPQGTLEKEFVIL